MKNYKFTVITFLDKDDKNIECFLTSMFNQTLSFKKHLQIIFIECGFSYTVRKTCRQHNKHIRYIYCEGKRVQSAINDALNMARGKYVYFMDAKDIVDSNFFQTIDNVFKLYPGQIVYAAMPVNNIHGYRETRIRSRQGTEHACLLNLNTAYGIGFTELSSVIFRLDCSPRFLEDIGIWEAKQTFLHELVGRSDTFVWLNEVSGSCNVQKLKSILEKNHADSWKMVLAYFGTYWLQEMQKLLKGHSGIPYYIQYSFLNEMIGFLSVLDQKAQDNFCEPQKFWEAVRPVLQMLDDALIIDALGMHDMSRIILFMNKKYAHCPDFLQRENDLEVRFDDTTVGMASYQSVILQFIKISNGTLHIEGETSISFCFQPKVTQIGVEVNGVDYPVYIEERTNHKRLLGEIYEYADTFLYTHKLKNNSDLNIRFYTKINEIKVVYHAITCMRFAPVSAEIVGAYAERDGYMMAIRGDSLICKKIDENQHRKIERDYQNELKKIGTRAAERAVRFRNYYFYFRSKKKRPIWLFFDRIDKADDNGEALFRYVCATKSKSVDSYFIINKNCRDYERLKTVGKVVAANTAKHQMLLALADYIFTSQLNGFVENPFMQDERYYRDIEHQAKVVFLQHGITKDNHTKWLNRFNQNLEGVITSAYKETESFFQYPYYYGKAQIWETGMPRYDYLYHAEKKNILVMPTWRERLMEQIWNSELKVWQWQASDGFRDSLYCRVYSSLFMNQSFLDICKKYGYQIVFLPHPLIQPYKDFFRVGEGIKVLPIDTTWRDAFAECNLMITDYSSVAFDFAYLRKPIIYYQFDSDDFFVHHTYQKGYFDYFKDGFGEVVLTEAELLRILEEYIKGGCKLKEKYRTRIDQFYRYKDKNNCKRIIERI